MKTYDYIIIGAGAAGLMLADALGKDVFFAKKSILVLDAHSKKENDRSWCFWEKGEGLFDDIVHRHWNHIYFGGQEFSKELQLNPYRYKMVRGIDFYASYFERIQAHTHITFKQEKVEELIQASNIATVVTTNMTYTAKQVFNSIYDPKIVLQQSKYPLLQQHFLGWFIKTTKAIFNPEQATFMDFSIPQKGNTRFMYVLPFSKTEALVEYTLFSKNLLEKEVYEDAISTYLEEKLQCDQYEITATEKGSIPMSCYDFSLQNSENIFYIGTAGGWSKPSTGYTFRNTALKTTALVNCLRNGTSLKKITRKNRYWYYDLLLLDILHKNNDQGRLIFESLFLHKTPQQIFAFLDEETSFWSDINVILGAPKKPFIEALLNRLL